MKKTLQNELKSNVNECIVTSVSKGNDSNTNSNLVSIDGSIKPELNQLMNNNTKMTSTVIMDDINLKYLKHVILKFLTSREVK